METNTLTNDVYSLDFQSKLDPFFTSSVKSDRWGKYSSWNKGEDRSLLATTKPIKTKVKDGG